MVAVRSRRLLFRSEAGAQRVTLASNGSAPSGGMNDDDSSVTLSEGVDKALTKYCSNLTAPIPVQALNDPDALGLKLGTSSRREQTS
jgi:hypothetical protein